MARPGTTEPDLVGELRKIQGRLDALERKPVPQSIYDRYPCTELQAPGRPAYAGNVWNSVGVANVTGLKYDRLEWKVLTYNLFKGEIEGELRVAAFRTWVDANGPHRQIISSSDARLLQGQTRPANGVGHVVCRWMHGIQYGWDFDEPDNAMYTVEVQHRTHLINPPDSDHLQVLAFSKSEKDANRGYRIDGTGDDYWGLSLKSVGGGINTYGWVTLPGQSVLDEYAISNMHYCIGVPQEIAPQATPNGWWAWSSAVNTMTKLRDASVVINEPYS
ncbi:hypothetical protein CPT_Shady_016 [Streptomyces phage Shady]|uniref:Minor tail protein n=1 Tax=Streptomyces phage Shady TaxID=2767585 RepID=A0A873WE69_9CAUD|nr:hypothetical protein CPT_Shady_016 [Streptomyces phage Shady]